MADMLPPVVGRIVGDNRNFISSLDEAERHVGGSTSRSQGMFSKLGGHIGTAVAIGAGAAAVAVGAFAVKAIGSASDLAETMSKVGVVFGDQKRIVTDFADDMAKRFGLPKTEILDAAASIGLIGKASGLAQPDAAAMSTKLAKLAADASSFYNVPLPEALQAIQSGLVGEAEPMRRFGVLLNENAVKNEAYALGLAETGAELTEGQKTQARSSLIMKGMSDASGDLERTQGSLANRLREVKGRAENFAASVGTVALPAVLDLFDGVEKLGGWLGETHGPVFYEVRGGISAFAAAFAAGDGDITSSGFPGFLERMGNTARTVFDWLRTNVPPVFDAVGAAFASVTEWVYANQATFQEWGNRISEMFTRVWGVISSAFAVIVGVVTVGVAVITDLWNRFGQSLVGHISTHFAAIWQVISGALQVVQGIFDIFAGIFTGDWSRVWDGIRGILAGVLDMIVGLVKWGVNMISTIIGGSMAAISALWSLAWHAIWTFLSDVFGGIVSTVASGIGDAVSWVAGLPGRAGSAILPLAGEIVGKAAGAVGEMATAISNGIGDAVGFVASLPGRAAGAIGDLGGILLEAGKRLIGGFIRGITDRIDDVKNTLTGLAGKLVAWKGPPSYDAVLLRPAGRLVIGGFVRGIEESYGDVRAALGGVGALLGSALIAGMLAQRSAVAAAAATVVKAAVAGTAVAEDRMAYLRSIGGHLKGTPTREEYGRLSFAKNAAGPNAGKPGYVQAEDGSWVPTSFYDRTSYGGLGTSAGRGGGTTTIHYAPAVTVQSPTGEISDESARRIREALIRHGRDLPGEVHLG